MLFGSSEEGDKFMRGWTKITDAPIRRQRAYVEQNSGGTLKFHVSIIAGSERSPNYNANIPSTAKAAPFQSSKARDDWRRAEPL
jgi:hypothetical protein